MHESDNDKKSLSSIAKAATSKNGNGIKIEELTVQLTELQKSNTEIREGRRAALNLMEDAILSKEALRKSEEKYRSIFENIDQGFSIHELIIDESGNVTDVILQEVNKAFEQHTGIKNAQGKKVSEIVPQLEPVWLDAMTRAYKYGDTQSFEAYNSDTNRWITSQYSRIGGAGSRLLATLFTDITERKQREQKQAYLLELSDVLKTITDPHEIQSTAVSLLGKYLKAARAGYAEDGGDGDTVVITRNYIDGVPSIEGTYQYNDYGPELVKELRAGRMVVRNDIAADASLTNLEKEAHALLQLGATVNVPLVKNGQLVAILFVHFTTAHHFSEQELALIEDTAERTWAAVVRARAEEALRKSEEKFRTLFETIDEGFTIQEVLIDQGGTVVDLIFREVNEAFEKHSGMEKALGKKVSDFTPHLEQHWLDALTQVCKTGEPLRSEGYVADLNRWFTYQYSRIGGEGSRLIAGIFNDITERKRHEQKEAFLSEISKDLVELKNINDTIELLGEKIAKQFNASWCNFAEMSAGSETIVVTSGWNAPDVSSVKGNYKMEDLWTEEQIEKNNMGEVTVVNDTQNDPRIIATNYAALNMMSFIAVPLARNGEFKFMIGVPDTKQRQWRDDEIDLAKELTTRIWIRLEKARAEEDLRRSEEKYRSLFNSIDEAFCIFNLQFNEEGKAVDWLYTEANPAFETQTGFINPVGKSISYFQPGLESSWFERFAEVARTAKPTRFTQYTRDMGIWYDVYAQAVGERGENRVSLLFTNITERKRHEQNQAFLSDITKDLVELKNVDDAFEVLGEKIATHLDVAWCNFAEMSDDTEAGVVTSGWNAPHVVSLKGVHKMRELWTEEQIEKNNKGEVTVVNDTQADPRVNAAAYGAMNILSFLTIPLARDGAFKFMVGIPDTKPRKWRADEIALAKEVTERIWTRLEKARAEKALRESEAKYATLFAASPVPFMVIEPNAGDFTITAANEAYYAATLTTPETLIGRRLFEVFPDDSTRPGQLGSEALAISLDIVLSTRSTDAMKRIRYDIITPNGRFEPHWWEAINSPMFDVFGNVSAIIQQVHRVTELHTAEELERKNQETLRESEEHKVFLLTLTDTIQSLTDPVEIQFEAARLVAEQLKADRALFAELSDDKLLIRKDYVRGDVPSLAGTVKPKVIIAATKLDRDEPVIINDIEVFSLLTDEEKAILAAAKIKSQLSVALSKKGKKVAGFSVDQTEPREWKPVEISILQDAAERTWAAVEKAKAEEALLESKERLRTVTDAVPQLIWTNDDKGIANFFNERWFEYSGCSFEQSVGKGWEAIVHPDDAPSSKDKWHKALAAAEIFDTEYRLKRHDGVYRWHIGRNIPLKNAEGKVVGWFGTATDIEDLKKAQENLRLSQGRLKTTMDSATDYAIISTNTKGIIEGWSSGAEQIFGYHEKEVLGKPADIIFTPEDRKAGIPEKEMDIATQKGRAIDERWHMRKDGSKFYASGVISLIEEGDLTGFVKVARDMTEVQRAQENLLILEERNRIALQSAEMAAWDWHVDKDTITWNDQHYYLLGLQPDYTEINVAYFLQFVHPDDKTMVQQTLKNAVETTGVYKGDFRIIRNDNNQERWMTGFGRIFNGDKNTGPRMIGVMFDITERKKLEQHKEDFIGIASHELKTPITSIKAYAELLQGILDEKGDVAGVELMRKLDGQVNRLINLIRALLDTSKLAEGELQLNLSSFNLCELIEERVQELQLTSPAHHLHLSTPKETLVTADREQVGQVLTNFISNAIKYSPNGGEITISCKKNKDEIQVSVKDSGIGILKEVQQKVFERFFRANNVQESTFPGMGLGLYITAQIVHLHGGKTWVQSTPGNGSTFYFSIPLKINKSTVV